MLGTGPEGAAARGPITSMLTHGSVLLEASLVPKSDGVELQSAASRCGAVAPSEIEINGLRERAEQQLATLARSTVGPHG